MLRICAVALALDVTLLAVRCPIVCGEDGTLECAAKHPACKHDGSLKAFYKGMPTVDLEALPEYWAKAGGGLQLDCGGACTRFPGLQEFRVLKVDELADRKALFGDVPVVGGVTRVLGRGLGQVPLIGGLAGPRGPTHTTLYKDPVDGGHGPLVGASKALSAAAQDPAVDALEIELQAPSFYAYGWTPDAERHAATEFVWWHREIGQEVVSGRAIVDTLGLLGSVRASRVAEFKYEFPAAAAGIGQVVRLLGDDYHTGLVVEWETGGLTVVELAWRNGFSGGGGKNQYTALPIKFPAGMRLPFDSSQNEIRIVEAPLGAATIESFFELASKSALYRNPSARHVHDFGGAGVTRRALHQALLTYAKKSHGAYSFLHINCQTFAAGLWEWYTNKWRGADTSVLCMTAKSQTAWFSNAVACDEAPEPGTAPELLADELGMPFA